MQDAETRTFLCGRYFTAEEIEQIRETVRVFSPLSWYELVQTICEHLDWVTPAGQYKIDSCAKAVSKLEAQGLVKMPAKRPCRTMNHREVVAGTRTDPEGEVVGTARDVAPVVVEPATTTDGLRLWNEYVQRYHGLGYKRPFGAHQRYFIIGKTGRLGCLLFASSAWALVVRDEWIGWTERDRAQRLNWVVTNTRFLIFPWVRIRNLASTALSLAAGRIREDWQERYGYRPVLLETFVEAERYAGTCYQAANWVRLGLTAGRGRMDREHHRPTTPKWVYVYPLVPDFRDALRGGGCA